MTEPTVEEIVAEIEQRLDAGFEGASERDDLRALISSWRERGEALANAMEALAGVELVLLSEQHNSSVRNALQIIAALGSSSPTDRDQETDSTRLSRLRDGDVVTVSGVNPETKKAPPAPG